jgi:hypothetical protein
MQTRPAVNRELLGGLAAAADRLFSVTLSIPSALLIYRWKRHGRGRYRRLSECIKRNGWQFEVALFRLFVNSATAIEWATLAAVSPVFERMTTLGRNDVWSDGLCQR